MRGIFIFAGQIEDLNDRIQALKNLIYQLPKINRMTLGALVANAQWLVVGNMTLTMFARVFAPLLIRYSCPEKEATKDKREFQEMFNTMFGLLQIDSTFYSSVKDISPTCEKRWKGFRW